MIQFISRALRRRQQKRTFREYGFQVKCFELPGCGPVHYAQWLHPSESEKQITAGMIEALRAYIREGDTVIDIGAHTGDTTLPMAIAAGPSGCTLALEPNPYVFKILAKNAALNPTLTNIVPLNFAATETDGRFTFHYSDAAYCNGGYLSRVRSRRHRHRYPLEVEGRDLDRFLRQQHGERLQRLSYIKTDTEGYDKDVIESIMSILQQFRPVLVTEVFKRLLREEREALFDVLDEAGYICFKCADGRQLRGEPVRREDMMKWPRFDILAIPRERSSPSLG